MIKEFAVSLYKTA